MMIDPNFKFTISRFFIGAWHPFLLTNIVVKVPEADESPWPYASVRRYQNLRGIEVIALAIIVGLLQVIQWPMSGMTHLFLWLVCTAKAYDELTKEYVVMKECRFSIVRDRFWRERELEFEQFVQLQEEK